MTRPDGLKHITMIGRQQWAILTWSAKLGLWVESPFSYQTRAEAREAVKFAAYARGISKEGEK